MLNYFYSSISSIALVVHLIINWRQLFDRRDRESSPGKTEFKRFLICLMLFFMTDILWGVLAALKYPVLLYADTCLFFLMMALSVGIWTRYVVTCLELEGWPRGCLLWTGRGLLMFFIAALFVNKFTGMFFRISDQAAYTAGPLRQTALLLLVAFNALSSGVTLCKLLRPEDTLHRRNKMVFVFGVTMMAAILLQIGNPFLPLYSIGCLFGCCLMHVFFVEEERDKMHRQELLAYDYEAKLKAERAASQAKSLFFSTVSHDIRTPLNAIVGFSELLEQGISDQEEHTRAIAAIRSSGKMLARLVDDILDLSKMENGKLEILKEPTDIPMLAREVIGICDVVRARKSLALRSEIGEMPLLIVDPHRVRQLLFNLLSNAYKYTMQGMITVRIQWQDNTLTFSVSDTGKGISEENITRIFQPFVQVADKNHRDGTGLGLAICRKLAELMDGELEVSSELGAGSTFTIRLRNVLCADIPNSPDEETELSAPLEFSQSRILIVDDSPVNRAVLKAMLARCGMTDVVLAENGREALAALKNGPHFDLVFTDLWMPEMDGHELVHAIRTDAKLSRLPVYLVTADVEARSQAESKGFTGILLKPITLDKLRQVFTSRHSK